MNSFLCADCGMELGEIRQAGESCPGCGSKRLAQDITPPPAPLGAVARLVIGAPTLRGTGTFTPPATGLLLQAVVIPGEETPEGSLITAIAPAWRAIVALLEKDPSAAFRIDPRKWEEIIAAAYDEAGFDEVTLTPRSGDLGRDVIAVKRGHFSVRFIEQVKAYGPGHRVPANDVRALLGVLLADPKTSKGIVTTTSEFAPKIQTDPLIAPFLPHRLELVDGKQLITKLADIAKGRTA